MVKRNIETVAGLAKRFARVILNINWNDHILAEVSVIQAKRNGFGLY